MQKFVKKQDPAHLILLSPFSPAIEREEVEYRRLADGRDKATRRKNEVRKAKTGQKSSHTDEISLKQRRRLHYDMWK